MAAQYIWSQRYIDAPILRDRDADADSETGDLGVTDSGLDQRLYYTTDANMNVTALLDTGGDAVERYVYDPYGHCTVYADDWSDEVSWTNSKQNHIRYCGYYFDNETGLYHVRHRSYHPALGRWLSRDPAGYQDGLSLLSYVSSRPATRVDPLGLQSIMPKTWSRDTSRVPGYDKKGKKPPQPNCYKARQCYATCVRMYRYCLTCEAGA